MLTPQQLQAIELLSNGNRTQESVATEVGVTRRTIVRWLANPEFQAALAGVGSNQFVVNQAVINPEIIQPQQSPVSIRQKLSELMPSVIEETESILKNPDTRTGDRLKAAQMLAKWGGLENRMDTQDAFRHLADLEIISVELLDFVIDDLRMSQERLENRLRGEFEPSKLKSTQTH